MNAWTILLLSAGLCALFHQPGPCVAVPAGSQGSTQTENPGGVTLPNSDIVSDTVTRISGTLRRNTRASSNSAESNGTADPGDAIENILNRVGELEGITTSEVFNVTNLVVSKISAIYRTWMQNVQSVIETLYSILIGDSDTGQRNRRSPLALTDYLPDLPLPPNLNSVLRNPLGLLEKSLSGVQSMISEQVSSALFGVIRTVWKVLVTQVFPMVRNVLQRIQNTNALPIPLSNAIRSLDTVLDVASLLSSLRAV